MDRSLRVALCFLCGCGGANTIGEREEGLASTGTFAAVADARVEASSPSKNFGRRTTVVADSQPAIASYLRFTVTGVSGRVVSATVRLTTTGNGTADGPSLYATSGGWSETGITWNNRPPPIGTALADTGRIVSGSTVGWDVTGAVAGDGTYDFVLVASSSDSVSFSSREAANPPQLVVVTDDMPDAGPPPLPSVDAGPPPPPLVDAGPPVDAAPPPPPPPVCLSITDGSPIDRSVRLQPAVALPASVGGSYIDPTYGGKIIRVTTVGSSMHPYSEWSALNANSTRLIASKAYIPTLYAVDPAVDSVAEIGPLFAPGPRCDWQDAAWSRTTPSRLYCRTVGGKQLYAYDVDSRTFSLLHDFTAELTAGSDKDLFQMEVDENEDVFGFRVRDSAGVGRKLVVWVRSTNTTYTRAYASGSAIVRNQIDKGGRYAIAWFSDRWEFWDFRAGTVQAVSKTAAERGGLGHQVAARNLYLGEDAWETGLLRRALADPTHPTHLLSYFLADGVTPNWTFTSHESINQADERWFVVSTYSRPANLATWDPWEQEILLVSTDGTFVKRLAHHHSFQGEKSLFPDDYWNEPRASVSLDGRYVVFTSNFDGQTPGDTSQRDVFLLRLPEICP